MRKSYFMEGTPGEVFGGYLASRRRRGPSTLEGAKNLTFNNSPVDFACFAEYLRLCTHPVFFPAKECASIFQFPGGSMSNAVRPIPEGYHSMSPQITCRDAAAAIDFYKNVLGATEL